MPQIKQKDTDKIQIQNKMEKEPPTQLEIVNELVKKSFGKRFSGNCIDFSNHSGKHLVNSCKLESIARRKGLYIPGIIEDYEVIGKFTSDDGSRLNVELEYLNGAERYATNYALTFKKNAWVNGKEIPIEFRE
jgi:hypothetical protein